MEKNMKNSCISRLKILFFVVAYILTPLSSMASIVTTNYMPQNLEIPNFFVPGATRVFNTTGKNESNEGNTTRSPEVHDLLNPTANWTSVFDREFGTKGWTRRDSAAELSENSLTVKTYDAIGTQTTVGAQYHINYAPGLDDPTIDTHDILWIQVVTNNHTLGVGGGHGIDSNIVDVSSSNTQSPYYDEGFFASATDFVDEAARIGDTENAHNWTAELFLVTAPLNSNFGDVHDVTVWSGTTWGWGNTLVPIPAAMWLFGSGLLGLIGVSMRRDQ
jgi:hypothetical protein